MNKFQEFQEIFKRYKNEICLIDAVTGQQFTFGKVRELACVFANNIKKSGLKKGARAAVFMKNSIETALVYYGCLYSGIIVIPVNPIYNIEEAKYIIRHSGAAVIFSSGETSESACSLAKDCGIIFVNVPFWNCGEGIFQETAGYNRMIENIQDNDSVIIVYTSGTTASPKGVVHNFASLFGNAIIFNNTLGIKHDNRFYGILSMAYLGGYYNLLLLPAVAGASVVIAPVFDVKTAFDFWSAAIRYKVNTLWIVPTIAAILLRMDRGQEGENYCRSNIKLALIGTAPLPAALRQRFEDKYGVILNENYALSETLFITSNTPYFSCVEGAVGKVIPGISLWIAGDDGVALPPGVEGEIIVRTPHLMSGYYDSSIGAPVLVDCAQDGFKTGDMGTLNDKGMLFVTGRKKDLIIRGGVNVSPAAIEDILYKHNAVEQAVVVGIQHDTFGEDIAAVIKLHDGYEAEGTLIEIKEFCKSCLGPHRQIGYIKVIDKFPFGPTGKILKRRVREMITGQ